MFLKRATAAKTAPIFAWWWMRSTCPTKKDHIDTFVLVSGDSDFSPLVSN
jgi:hypothetical protein